MNHNGGIMHSFIDDDNSMYKRFASYEEDHEDGEFLKCFYPPRLVSLQLLVEDECDKLEFDGSIMFDQYPDKVRLMGIANRVEKKAKEDTKIDISVDRNLLEVMVINEVMRRRIRRRNCRKQGFC